MKKLLLSKGIIIASSVILITLFSYVLYNSFATNTSVTIGNNNTYTIVLTDSSNTVTVPAKSSKTVYYQFNNTNKGTVSYHIGYTSTNVVAKTWWDSKDSISGTAAYGEYKFVKLKLINDTTSSDTITIKAVLGFENGGNIIPDSNTTLITGTIAETNTMSTMPAKALNTLEVARTAVEEVSFTNDNIVPASALGSTNMNNDGTVKLWYEDEDENDLYEVYIGSDNGITKFPSSSGRMFDSFVNKFNNLETVNFDYVDTSSVTSLEAMFYSDSKLANVNFENFNTTNVSTMSNMFSGCSSLTELDLDSFYTPNLTGFYSVFAGCTNLEKLSFKNINTSQVTDMSYLFRNCGKLTGLDLADLDTSNVESMYYMFAGTKLSQINIDTSSCQNMAGMFGGSTATSLNLSTFDTSDVNNMEGMFNGCRSLTILDLSNFDTSKVTNFSRTFYWTTIRKLYIGNFTFGSASINEMFGANNSFTLIDMRNADLTNTTNNSSIFGSVPSSVTIYMKDTQGNRDYMSTNYSNFNNVQYIS